MHEYQRTGCKQAVDMRLHGALVRGDGVIAAPLLSAHHRIEAFGVKVAQVDVPAPSCQRFTTTPFRAAAKLSSQGWAKTTRPWSFGGFHPGVLYISE
jgi:hypothetical protein